MPRHFVRNLLILAILCALPAILACSPKAEETPAEAEETALLPGVGDVPPLPAQEEGSDPKEEAPFGGAETTAEGVDTSIRDAGDFGDDALLEGLAPEGWSQTADIEHYNVARLYNKINGRSELYMAYDVIGLSWVSFVNDADDSSFLDLFIYDMRSPTGAFGIYSVEREVDQPPIDAGREGYRTGSNYYFWKGKHYGYINASKDSESNQKAGLGILTAFIQRIVDDGSPVVGLDWLPKDGLIEDSVQYFRADAMSLDFLTDTFIAAYQLGDDKVRAYVSKRDSDDEAAGILAEFETYGNDYADSVEKITVDGVEVTVADWGGDFYDAMFHIGPMVAGLSNVEGKEVANRSLSELIDRLKN